ncbi:CDT1-like protein a, chloroplastic [Sesamum indicum]|uniref:CDT1-like protein a, chloroplastic n=1 Tax=Sesamum indicum TaxID=4182 RepID=A0A6I9TH80_SESIN|nr:CDT1-like protein a, chloroplastic [Sesamum indicum]
MDAGKSSPLSMFKSKKQLHLPASSDQEPRKVAEPAQNPWSVKTPGKPVDAPRRLRHRGAVMSIKEVREAAMKLREGGSNTPARTDPLLGSEKEDIVKSKKKSVDAEIQLPEKYELLDKFFNSLDSSIRLLQLKRSATTFTNISSQIESLTDRRFTYGHLAQLKFILPEAILVEKVLRHDERTSCMKPDLRITLNVEAIESKSKSKSHSRNLHLRKIFRGRLLDFFTSHPEGDEVPEEDLPEPFTRLKASASISSVQPSASSLMSETTDGAVLEGRTVTASHLSASFKRSFSQRGSGHLTANIKEDQVVVSNHASVDVEHEFPGKETSSVAAKSHSKSSVKPSGKEKCSFETPVKCKDSIKDEDQLSVEMTPLLRTPVDLLSTPAKLMSATPMLHPPKRCYMSPDGNSSRSPSKLVRRPPPNRPLKFDTPVKSVKVDGEFGRSSKSSADDDILPEALLQSIREKERLASMEKDPAISQAKRRQQMIASLPKLFDMIYFLYQSIRRSIITKEELIQKIITGHLDIVDRREVEEQLRLLQELAPEWIYEKLGSSGDILLCVNKISSPEVIRTKLSEAK